MQATSLARALRAGLLAAAALAATATARAETTVPYTFAAGSPAKAGEVNANFQALASAINALSARLDRAEGRLTAADIVGTYRFQSLQTELNGGASNNVRVYTFDGTVTFNADGTVSFSTTDVGAQIRISGAAGAAVSVTRSTINETNPTGSANWTLNGSVLSIGGGPAWYVADGGRLMIQTGTNTADATSKVILMVRTN